jgi:hypothetical protein
MKTHKSVPLNSSVADWRDEVPLHSALRLGPVAARMILLVVILPVVLITHERQNRGYCNLAAVKEAYSWEGFCDPLDFTAAEAGIERFQSVDALLYEVVISDARGDV